MASKFKIGDKVTIRRVDSMPQYILDNMRLDHPRTITAIYYDKTAQHNRYYLGSNKRGYDISHIPLRASVLNLWIKGKIGRPKTKRTYIRRHSVSSGVL